MEPMHESNSETTSDWGKFDDTITTTEETQFRNGGSISGEAVTLMYFGPRYNQGPEPILSGNTSLGPYPMYRR